MSSPSRERHRADVLVCQRGLAPSRARAQSLIMAGQVYVGEARVEKAGTLLPADAELRVAEARRFVSRGGDKLDAALRALGGCFDDLSSVVALDVGASTGGFTDCLLQRGASRVYAVDVGYGQLHARLRADPRVVCRERTNARDLQPGDLDPAPALCVVDASFIGLGKLLGPIRGVLAPGGDLVALIKPQFEAGREEAARGRGVIRDASVRDAAIASARAALREHGFAIIAEVNSALPGPRGNLERFVHARADEG